MEKKYIVYKHTFPNGKVYIGITKQPEKRWAGNGKNYYYNKRMFFAFKKYGDSVKQEILFEELTYEEANFKEEEMITFYDSNNKNKGYNQNKGGFKNTHAFKPIVQYDLKGNIIRRWDSASKASRELNIRSSVISNTCRGIQKTSGGFIWKYPGDNDLSINLAQNKTKKCVIQYDLKGNFIKEWESESQASRELNISSSSISLACLRKLKTAGGFIWKYPGDMNFSFNFSPFPSNKLASKKILQYDLKGKFVKEWCSITQASKELNINESGISNVCRGKVKTSGGFIWKFPGDIDFTKNLEPKKNLRVILQYELNGNFIKEWTSISSISKELNINILQIWKVCKGILKTAGGFIWKYEGDTDFTKNLKEQRGKKVIQYDLQGNFIKKWGSINQASKELNINSSQIWRVCKGKKKQCHGFIWKYANSSDKLQEKVV